MEELKKEFEFWNNKYLEVHEVLTRLMQPDNETQKPQLTLAKIDHLYAEEQKAYKKRRQLFEEILKLKQ